MDSNELLFGKTGGDERQGFRAKKGDVPIAILDILSTAPLTGYSLMQKIKERSSGIWRVSSGSIYPALERLESRGFITQNYRDRNSADYTSVYSITSNGKSHLASIAEEVKRIWNFNTGPDLENLSPTSEELVKLAEVIELALRTNSRLEESLVNELGNLRKRIFGWLAK